MKNNINALRRSRGLSWQKLADKTGISKPTLHRIANGKIVNVRLIYLDILASVFDVTVSDILEADPVETPYRGGFR